MEMTSLPVSASTIICIVVSVVPALAAFAVLAIIARTRTAHLWLVPGWLAASVLGPVLCTFFSVRLVIDAFQSMAMSGGGVSTVSAGMWEATRLLVICLYVSCALAVITLVIALRAVITQDADESAGSGRARAAALLSILPVVAVALVSTLGLFHHVTALIFGVLDPHAHQSLGIAEAARVISFRVLLAGGTAIAMTLFLLAGIVVTAIADPRTPPRAGMANFLVFAALLFVLAIAGSTLAFRSSANRLHHAALTGEVTR